MSDIGVSFSPFNQSTAGKQQGVGSAAQPVQDAIKILSLRVPTTVGASSGAPQSLLGGPTALGTQLGSFAPLGGGQPGQLSDIQEFLRRLMLSTQGAPALGSTAAVSPFGTQTDPSAAPPDASIAPSAMPPGEGPQAPPDTGGLPVSVSFGDPNQQPQPLSPPAPQPITQPAAPPSPSSGTGGLGEGRANAGYYPPVQTY